MKKALVVIDMQNDFVTGTLGTKEAQAIVPNVVAKIEKCLAEKYDLYFTRDTHHENYLHTQEGENLPIAHCVEGTDGWKIIPELKKYEKLAEIECNKETFGSVALSKRLGFDYDEIELIGVCTDICVVSNALLIKAFDPEVPIVVDATCCAGVTPEKHESALETMRSCQVNVI